MTGQSVLKLIKNKHFHAGLVLAISAAAIFATLPTNYKLLFFITLLGVYTIPLILQKPEWVVWALIIFIPLEEFLEKWLPRGILYEGVRFGSEVILLLLLFFVLLNKSKKGHRWHHTPVDLPLFLFVIVAIISGWLNSTSVPVWFLGVRPLIRYATIFYILTQLRINYSFFTKCFTLSLLIASLVAIIGLLQTVVGYPLTNLLIPGDIVVGDILARTGQRHVVPPRTYIFSTMGRYDTLGLYLMFFSLLSGVAYTFVKERRLRRAIFLFLLVGLPALALTFSRQSWVGLGLGFAIVLVLSRKKEFQRTKLFYVLGLVISGVFILLLIPYAQYFSAATIGEANLLERILEPFSSRYLEVSRNYYGRLYIIFEVGPRLLQISPLFGLGPGQFGSLASRFFNISFAHLVGVPENAAPYISDVNWIVILGQTGLLGLLSFFWIYVSLFLGAFKRYRKWFGGLAKGVALGYAGSIFAVLFLGFLGPNFEVRQISFFVWLWGGLLIGLKTPEEN